MKVLFYLSYYDAAILILKGKDRAQLAVRYHKYSTGRMAFMEDYNWLKLESSLTNQLRTRWNPLESI